MITKDISSKIINQSQNNSDATLDTFVKKFSNIDDSISDLKTKLDAQQGHINTLK